MNVELILLVFSLLFFISIFADKAGSKIGVPALLVFLGVGMLFGEDGLVGIDFDNMSLANAIGTVALCVILFAGAMDTDFHNIRPVFKEGITLATLGVVLTCMLSGVAMYFLFNWFSPQLGVTFSMTLLLAATMSSTDAGSVFSILRGKGINLKHNLGPILELESGSNDPMAYILVTILIQLNTTMEIERSAEGIIGLILGVLVVIVIQVAVGFLIGFGFGKGIVWLMRNVRLSNDSFYPILTIAACIFIFSLTYYLHGNSYLAVYVGGLVIGNSRFPKKRLTANFFDSLSWLCQLAIFLLLGLLASPHKMLPVIVPAMLVSFSMIFVARPLSVLISLTPYRWLERKDKYFLSWVGLKGAVPIILAIMCVDKNVPDADIIFNIIFVCVIVSLVVQGGTLERLADKFDLSYVSAEPPAPTHFDIDLPEEIRSVATEMIVTEEMVGMDGKHLMEMGIPHSTLAILVKRGQEYFVPSGQTLIEDGDILLLVSDREHALVQQYKNKIVDADASWELEFIDDTNVFLRNKIRQRQSKRHFKL